MKITGILTILFAVVLSLSGWTQARIVFQNDPYIVLNDQAYLVIDNPNANAVTNPAQGNVVSEDEFNYVKWNIGTSLGIYNMPLTTANSFKVPVTVNIAGSGSGGVDPCILFSSYGGLGTANWDSDVNKPTPVLHTVDFATGSVNNSPFVIDRYWIIDAGGYNTKPSATLSIGYADEEHQAAGNTITESALGAQRYNSTNDVWGDYLPAGSINITTNLVSAIPAPAADLFRAWTLASLEMPLPVELTDIEANCNDGVMKLNWTTASEHNNDYFLIERSADGIIWETFREVPGNGNSSTTIDYKIEDYTPLGTTCYYRLTQFDYNGAYKIYDPVAGNCSDFDLEIVSILNNYNSDQMLLNVSSSFNDDFDLYVMDMSGKVLIAQSGVAIKDGMNQVEINKSEMTMGIYIIQLVNDEHLLTRKVAIN